MKNVFYATCILVLSLFSLSLHAGGKEVAHFDMQVHSFVRSPIDMSIRSYIQDTGHRILIHNYVFASIPNYNSIAVIDMDTLLIVNKIPVGKSPAGLAISPDGQFLYVSLLGESAIDVVDLSNRYFSVELTIPIPTPAYDIEIGNGRLYATPTKSNNTINGIMQIALDTKVVTTFSHDEIDNYKEGFLEISPDKNTLYFANKGLGYLKNIAKFNISTDSSYLLFNKSFKYHYRHMDICTNFHLTNDGKNIFYTVLTERNRISKTYVTTMLSTQNDLTEINRERVSSIPRLITSSPNSTIVYSVLADSIGVFNTKTFSLIKYYSEPTLKSSDVSTLFRTHF